MNRNEEYRQLCSSLNETPPALETIVDGAVTRAKKRDRVQRAFTSLGGLAACAVIFVVLVNVSLPVARACGKVPLLRELASAVAFSPSLSAAIQNEYVQPIDLQQKQMDITMRVEYVIVDQKQINVFYTLRNEDGEALDGTPSICNADGTVMGGYGLSSGYPDESNGALRRCEINFTDADVPSELIFEYGVRNNGSYWTDCEVASEPSPDGIYEEPEFIATFSFLLQFDPAYTSQGKTLVLNQPFVLDGQHLIAESVDIYPTHIRLNLQDDENNTAWLKSLSFYMENEKGKRFEVIGDGITATGSADSPFMPSHRLESAYFSESKQLTLYITGATWLEKDRARIRVDLANGETETLPQGVQLVQAKKSGDGWRLAFSCLESAGSYASQPFQSTYYDEAGNAYEYNTWTVDFSNQMDAQNMEQQSYEMRFTLEHYPYDVVYLVPQVTRSVRLETPVVLTVDVSDAQAGA